MTGSRSSFPSARFISLHVSWALPFSFSVPVSVPLPLLLLLLQKFPLPSLTQGFSFPVDRHLALTV